MNHFFSFSRVRRDASRRRVANGFTLMELLIVMAIISVLMLIGFPSYKAIMKKTHEMSAKKSLQSIQQAEQMYATSYPSKGFACDLKFLGGDAKSGPPSATAAQLLPEDLTLGYKDGYNFAIVNCTKNNQGGSERVDDFMLTATPSTVGKTGDKGFCYDNGEMKQDPAGGVNCTEIAR